ncbi:VPLPA-CTERM sorting domain-containing protein [Yoonia sp. F2084L]|uniref:VPLPA-CTERM sorting domain-containing protein n=1 Tax=Yoonia sp. F2084L TaxID=2926419 RepID=UPI001FF1ADAF|nr:VPLPA-CTERM sorting domain-containing protein [Yoonia sp. F2084L]MCK0096474.1 VPLPA-CTERM sorting domain-containing protein [Yoonia sp. F2084L]
MKWFKISALAAAMAIATSGASAATVINGSFEDIGDGALNGSGWNIFSSVPGWTGSPNIEIQSDRTLGSIDAQDGNYYAELDTNQDAGIFQNIALDAGSYSLSFWYSPRVNADPTTTNDMSYSVAGAAETYIDNIITGAPNPAYPHGAWTNVVANFTIDSDQTIALSFAALGGSRFNGCGNCGALIDNVTIAAVPLPAGILLMLTAVGAFGFARRRPKA